ncbi:hypothetical protein ACET3Z_013392 [Daucus carota]
MQAQEASDYGVADKIIGSRDNAFKKRDYDSILAQSKAMRGRTAGNPQAAPSGFRNHCGAANLPTFCDDRN